MISLQIVLSTFIGVYGIPFVILMLVLGIRRLQEYKFTLVEDEPTEKLESEKIKQLLVLYDAKKDRN